MLVCFVRLFDYFIITKRDKIIRSGPCNITPGWKRGIISAWYFVKMKLINKIIAALI